MKLNFEEFLNDNELRVGDKIKVYGDIYYIAKGSYLQSSENELDRLPISVLYTTDFELVKPKKKVGDLICGEGINCPHCPLKCLDCGCGRGSSLREIFEITFKEYPQLEPMRPYLENELNKEQ